MNFVDGAEFFTALFGSDRFEHLVGPVTGNVADPKYTCSCPLFWPAEPAQDDGSRWGSALQLSPALLQLPACCAADAVGQLSLCPFGGGAGWRAEAGSSSAARR